MTITGVKTKRNSLKRLIPFSLPLIALFLVLLAGEGLLRVYHRLRFDVSFIGGQSLNPGNSLSNLTLDSVLGWRATENYRSEGPRLRSDRTSHIVKFSQDGNGFRMFGDLSTHKPRIFVVGDSYTQAVNASDDETYFAVMKRHVDAEVFAYGAGGFGSLQEYMIFDKYVDLIRPDLILWQFTGNDIVNNSPVLEAKSVINNNGLTRPYLIDNEVRYILAKDLRNVRTFSIKYCRLCYTILNRIDLLRASQDTVEDETSVGERSRPLFMEALRTTDEIIGRVRKRAGSIPIIAFVVANRAPSRSEY